MSHATPLPHGWHRHTLPSWCDNMLSVYADPKGQVFLGGFNGLARRNPNGEVTYCELRGRSNFVKAIDGDGDEVVAYLHRGTACTSQDAGATWTQRRTGWSESGGAVCCLGDGQILISGRGLVRSTDGGRRFEPIEVPGGVGGMRLGADGAIYGTVWSGPKRSTDGGLTWEELRGVPDPRNSGKALHLLAVAHIKGGRLFALTFHGVYRSDDHGETWELCGGDGLELKHIDTDGDKLVIAVGKGALLRSTDGGDTFQRDDIGVAGEFTQVHCHSGQAWVISRNTLLSYGVEVAEAEPPPPIGAEEPIEPPPETWHHPPSQRAPSKAPPRDEGPPVARPQPGSHTHPITGGCFWGDRVITADMSGLILVHARNEDSWSVVARHTTPNHAPADHFVRHRERVVCLLRHDLWSFDPDSGEWFEHGRLPTGHLPDRIIVRGDRLYAGHHLGVVMMSWDDASGTWTEQAQLHGDSADRYIDLSPDGTRLLSRAGRSSRKPELHLLNAADLTTEAVIQGNYKALGALFSFDDALIIVHGVLGFHAAPSFILRRVSSGRASGKGADLGTDPTMHLLLTPDRETAVTISRRNTLRIIDVATRQVLTVHQLREEERGLSGDRCPKTRRALWPRVAALSEDGAMLLVGDGAGEAVVFDLDRDSDPVLGPPQPLSPHFTVSPRPVSMVTRIEGNIMAVTRADDTIYVLFDDHTLYTVAMDDGEVGYCGGSLTLRRSRHHHPRLLVVGDMLFYFYHERGSWCDAFDLVTGAQLWEGDLIQSALTPWRDGYAYTFANGHHDRSTNRAGATLFRVHARTGATEQVKLPPPPDGDDASHYFGRLTPTPWGMLLNFSHREGRFQSYFYRPEQDTPLSAPMPPPLTLYTSSAVGLSRNGRYMCNTVGPRSSGWILTDLDQGMHRVGRFNGESHHLVRDGIQHITASDDGMLVVGLSAHDGKADMTMWDRDGAVLAIYQDVPNGPIALTRDERTALIWNRDGVHRIGLAERA